MNRISILIAIILSLNLTMVHAWVEKFKSKRVKSNLSFNFATFSKKLLVPTNDPTKRASDMFFINIADEYERDYANEIILYHGERYSIWLLQLLMRRQEYRSNYLDENDIIDWLPLRAKDNFAETVDAEFLQRVIKKTFADHAWSFVRYGMSFHPNMVGRLFGETPWFASDMTRWWFGKWGKWYSSSGYARRAFKPILRDSLPRQMEGLLPEQRNERLNCIENQFIAILWFIGKSLNYKVYHKYSKHALNSLFPGLNSTDLDFIVNMPPYDRKRRAHPVGVILQVVMNHEMLKKYCYASKPFGRPLEEDVQSFYQRIKNKKDSAYSIRCAIGNDFHNKTSGIRIRAITPIAKDKEAMERIMRMLDGVGNQQVCEKNAKLPSLNAKLIRNARKGNLGEVNDLIKAGADIDSWDNHSKTSLFWAARNGHVEVVRALLKARADVNAQDNHGRTPLMEAALQGHIEIVQALISAEADVKMLDMDNMTAFALIKKRFFKPKNYAAIKAALKASK